MNERELICIGCPMGCPIVVKMEDGKVTSVTGNTCPRGEAYARKEVTDPTRIVTTTVRVADGKVPTNITFMAFTICFLLYQFTDKFLSFVRSFSL